MNNEFISYEMALELKELGFDEPCFTYYYNITNNIRTGLSINIHNAWTYAGTKKLGTTLAPTISQAFRFFREKFNLFSCVQLHLNFPTRYYFIIDEIGNDDFVYHTEDKTIFYDKYEDAEIACLKLLSEILKNKNMQRIKVDPTKVIEGKPIMRKETGIEYLADIYDDEDFARPDVFRTAYFKQLDSIDEFSLWLVNEDWMPNYGSGLDKGKWERVGDDLKTMSELYQIFLEQNKKQNEY